MVYSIVVQLTKGLTSEEEVQESGWHDANLLMTKYW